MRMLTCVVATVFGVLLMCGSVYAQLVHIPDPNLRAAIYETLRRPAHHPLTAAAMRHLTKLEAPGHEIADLTGLEYAIQLEYLELRQNPLSDLTPLANLNKLRRLFAWSCQISDIRPIGNLRQLEYLDLHDNRLINIDALVSLTQLQALTLSANTIADVQPLRTLTRLTYLDIRQNLIIDVTPLSNLTALEVLRIERNRIFDHTPLNGLPLIEFTYDEECVMPRLPLQERLSNRNFPSTFSFWGPSEEVPLHDLVCCHDFHMHRRDTPDGIKLVGRIDAGIQERDRWLSRNPNTLFIGEVRIRDAFGGHFDDDSPYWLRDPATGDRIPIAPYEDLYLINNVHPEVQQMIIEEAIAISKCGLFDGVFFDHWRDNAGSLDIRAVTPEEEHRARENIIRSIRAATDEDFLIIGNTNDRIIPATGSYLNGGFMEVGMPSGNTGAQLERVHARIEQSLHWLEQNLRTPLVNSLEARSVPSEPPDSPNNLRWMRAMTTLSLTHSDGYVLYSSGGSHRYIWYDFWDADLGQPVGEKAQLYQGIDGLYIREYTNGWAVYNHSGAPQVIRLPEEVEGVASGLVNVEHALANLDGEMYLKAVESGEGRVASKNPADVNGDGVVNILDLTLVAQGFGKDSMDGDVNGDGVVNVFDLVFVANQF